MFDLYTVAESERLDQLAYRLFGVTDDHVEAILDANPGLADDVPPDEPLDIGRVLRIPQDTVSDEVEVVRLWT